MAQFPVAPRYAKMLALGGQQGCLPYIVALVSALSVKELLVESVCGGERVGLGSGDGRSKWARLRRMWAGKVGD